MLYLIKKGGIVMFGKGILNGLFDINGDGKMDGMERILEFAAFVDFIESQKEKDESDDIEV